MAIPQVREYIIENSLKIAIHIDHVKAYHPSNKNSEKEEISSRPNQSLSYAIVSLFKPDHNKCSMYYAWQHLRTHLGCHLIKVWISFLGLPWQMAYNNREEFSRSPAGQKSKLKVSTGLHSLQRLSQRIHFLPFPASVGSRYSWLMAISL